MAPRIVPRTDDPDHAGHWEAATRHVLAIRACRSCQQPLHLPRQYCAGCGSWDTEWRAVAGTGALYSWTTVWRQAVPAFAAPYTCVLVDVDDAPDVRLVGHIPGSPDLRAGMPMRVRFEPIEGTDVVLPQWEPVPPFAMPSQRDATESNTPGGGQ
jgi:uncharacterized OB-fold protein